MKVLAHKQSRTGQAPRGGESCPSRSIDFILYQFQALRPRPGEPKRGQRHRWNLRETARGLAAVGGGGPSRRTPARRPAACTLSGGCVIRPALRWRGAGFGRPLRRVSAWRKPGKRGLPASSANASGLAGRYAVALFELARGPGCARRGRRAISTTCAPCSTDSADLQAADPQPGAVARGAGPGDHGARRARRLRAR